MYTNSADRPLPVNRANASLSLLPGSRQWPTPTTRAAAPALKVRNGLVRPSWLGEAGTARLGLRGPVGGCRTRCLRPRSTAGIAGPPRRRTRRIRSVSATGRDGHSRWWRMVGPCARYGGSSTRGSRGSRLLPDRVTGGAGDGAHRDMLVSGSRFACFARTSWLVVIELPRWGLLHPFAEIRRSLEGAGGLTVTVQRATGDTFPGSRLVQDRPLSTRVRGWPVPAPIGTDSSP